MGGARRRKARAGPSDPREIRAAALEARGDQEHAERLRARTPGEWGVLGEIKSLHTSGNVEVVHGLRGRVLAAKRSDPFDLLHQHGSLADLEHQAARRLFRDMCIRAGVKDHDRANLERIDVEVGRGALDHIIDAGGRVDLVLGRVGPVNARLLRALMEPLIRGEIRVWRVVVQEQTGESERHAQGASVRLACKSLAAVYDEIDQLHARAG